MDNRMEIAKKLLTEDGVFECAIDDNENESLGLLLENRFNEYDKTCITIQHNPSGTQSNNFSCTHEYTYFIYPKVKSGRIINLQERDDESADIRNFMNTAKGNGENYLRKSGKTCFYPIIVNKNFEILSFGKVCDDDFHPNSANQLLEDGNIAIYPIDSEGIERKWVFSRNTVEEIKEELFCKKVNSEYRIIRKKNLLNFKTVWLDNKYSAKENGTNLLNKLGLNVFDFPKSLYNVQDCILAGSQNNSLILDFFPGSGTTAHAIIDLNRNNPESRRKYILTELGNHFNTVILPRIKKVCFSDKWKDGKAQDGQGITQFFKYYKLEQYEDTLRNMKYKDSSPNSIFDTRKAFEQYIFYADQKFAHVLEIGKDKLDIDFDKLYPNIDFAETISNLLGLPIKKITKTSVILQDEDSEREIKTDYKNMNESEKLAFVRLLKPAIWWGE